MNDHPMIYCNGDSYSDERYHQSLIGKTYVNSVADYCKGFAINKAISGSCNRRIVRTTLHDMIEHRRINPEQKTIVLLGLSFELRSEIWIENVNNTKAEESSFKTHVFSSETSWRENLLKNKDIGAQKHNRFNVDHSFFDYYSKGRAYFYSPYAERINLLADLIMMRSMLESLNIDFLIFQSPTAEKLDPCYLLDFFKEEIKNDRRFFNFEDFGFCSWCKSKNFIPLDMADRLNIAHYGPDAHRAFALDVLIPRLQELKFL